MSLFTNTVWHIFGNGFAGDLIINDDPSKSTMYGDPLIGVAITGKQISFTRQGNGFQKNVV